MRLLFWIRKNQVLKDGSMPIYCRITILGQRVEMTTDLNVSPDKWDAKRQKIKGNVENAVRQNYVLLMIKYDIKDLYNQEIHANKNVNVSAYELKEKYLFRHKPNKINGSETYLHYRCQNCTYREEYYRNRESVITLANNVYKK